jgi:hypothetical protein
MKSIPTCVAMMGRASFTSAVHSICQAERVMGRLGNPYLKRVSGMLGRLIAIPSPTAQ